MRKIFIAFLFLLVWKAYSQNGSARINYYKISADTLFMDSLTLVSGTEFLSVNGKIIEPGQYIIQDQCHCLIFKKKPIGFAEQDSFKLRYKVYPLDFNRNYFKKDITLLNRDQSQQLSPFSIKFNGQNPQAPVFQNDGLMKNGSISRGISFGNNQDVVVNSSLNLQVSGKLSKEIELVLAATDNNIPIQADGNTQQLQEFDKVYIQLNDEHSKVIMGDFQLSKPKSNFLHFYKRTQGIYLENSSVIDTINTSKIKLNTKVSAAVSRGKFARNEIQGIENNQGPYRLRGADNELFIVVLSGTERVYIDGKLLIRGQENEYVIDYNTAEITFTAKQIITKDKRIKVEFQYSERNYNRSLYYISEELQGKNWNTALHLFSEQDNKNKTFQQDLTNEEKLLMRDIGDTLSLAVTNGAAQAEFNSTEVFYIKRDTTTSSSFTYSIYEYSISPDTAYRVRFSYVGEGKGNYRQIQSLANGRVYEWAEPVSGLPQGNYEPVIVLVTPKQKQMLVLNGNYLFTKNNSIAWEGAYSKNDLNRFSPFNSADDNGFGGKLQINNAFKVGAIDSVRKDHSYIIANFNYEFIDKNFSQIERFRSVEFNRDWNRSSDSVKNIQHLFGGQVGFKGKKNLSSLYSINGFEEEGFYTGLKHQLENNFRHKGLTIQFNPSLLETKNKGSNTATSFYRHKSRVTQQIKNFMLAYIDEMEQNRLYYKTRDSLMAFSYSFWEREGSIGSSDSSGNTFKLFYRERTDKKVSLNNMKPVAYAQNYGASAAINSIKNHNIKATFIYRELKILDSILIANRPDNTLLSRLEYAPKLWKGFLQANFYYEIGYGLEQKKEYSFVQVAAGQGQYYWNDYNENGIKELNEFEIAQYTDQAIFIKVYTPTNNYVKAAHDQFSGSVFLRPAVFKKSNSAKFMKLVSRFSTQTVYRTDSKLIQNNNNTLYNPFDLRIHDSVLLSTSTLFRQALFFNQNSAVWGFDYNYQDNKGKQLLVNGLESRSNLVHEFHTRINFSRSIGFYTTTNFGTKSSFSEYLNNRNYNIDYYEVEPKLVYQPSTSSRVGIGYKRSEKTNEQLYGGQHATIDDILLELKFNKLNKGSFTLRADYLLIQYNEEQNSPVSFEMLNSLKPGQNITWSMQYQQNLSNNLQISFNYDGRKTPNNKIIHIGGAQVRAFF